MAVYKGIGLVYYNNKQNSKQPNMTNFPPQMTNVEDFTLPAGRYFIADPCFAIDNDKWVDFLGELEHGEFEFEGQTVFTVETGGDGIWNHNDKDYYIEAGLFGAVPAALVEREGAENNGVWVDVDDDTEVEIITDNYSSFRGVRIGEVELVWREIDEDEIVEFAYENEDYTLIDTAELFAALVDYIGEDEEEELEALREALPHFA